jgi:neutral ceramidase
MASRYARGETVTARFWSANPTDNFPKRSNYLLVERKTPGGWRGVADDGDWTTWVRWQLDAQAYVAELSWAIPQSTPLGDYRVSHFGFDATGSAFSGTSSVFSITGESGR